MVNLKNQTVWIKNFAYSKVFGKMIKRNKFKYFGKTWKHRYWCQVSLFRMDTTFENRSKKIFMLSGNNSFSGDKSNINFKETYSSPNHFLTTLKLILLQPQQ